MLAQKEYNLRPDFSAKAYSEIFSQLVNFQVTEIRYEHTPETPTITNDYRIL